MKILHDTWLIFKLSILLTKRTPIWLFVGLFQPICFLLLFAPLLKNVMSIPSQSTGEVLTMFVPGLIIMMAMYGAAFVGFNIIDDLRSGVLERMQVTTVSRLALLLGRSLRDVVILLIQSFILIIVAILMGMKASLMGVLLAFVLVALLGLCISAASYALALTLKSEDALAPAINFILVPVQLLSGITLPLALAPAWIQNVALANPLAHSVNACRALFLGNFSDNAIIIGFIVMILLTLISVSAAYRIFKSSIS